MLPSGDLWLERPPVSLEKKKHTHTHTQSQKKDLTYPIMEWGTLKI